MVGSDWVKHPDPMYEYALFLLGSFWARGHELQLMRQRFPGVSDTDLSGALKRGVAARQRAESIPGNPERKGGNA